MPTSTSLRMASTWRWGSRRAGPRTIPRSTSSTSRPAMKPATSFSVRAAATLNGWPIIDRLCTDVYKIFLRTRRRRNCGKSTARTCMFWERIPTKDPAVFGYGVVPAIDVDPKHEISVSASPGSKYAIGRINPGVSPNSSYYIEPVDAVGTSNSAWRKLADLSDKVSRGRRAWRRPVPADVQERVALQDPAHRRATSRSVVRGSGGSSDATPSSRP